MLPCYPYMYDKKGCCEKHCEYSHRATVIKKYEDGKGKKKKVKNKSEKMAAARWALARDWVLEKVRRDRRRQIRRNLDAERQRQADEKAAREAAEAAAILAEEAELDDELMRLDMATEAFQQLWQATAV